VSELPRSAPGANPSVRARFIGAAAPTRTRSLTVIEQSGARPLPASGVPASGRAAHDAAPGDDRMDLGSARLRYHDDDMLTVADAARLARRSVRTLRRAYLSGKLLAHRDGNGRSVSIRYGDLRAWLTAEVIGRTPASAVSRVIARVDVRARADAAAATGNQELLSAALQRRGKRARASAAPRPAAARIDSGSR
jgi:hypothetical protein